MWRWRDSLNFLRAGDFGRTRPLSVSAFPRVDSSMAFERRDDRADCMRDTCTVNRGGRRRWKRSSVALSAAPSTTSIEKMEWAFIDLRGTRNFDDVCCWLLCDFNHCPKLRKFVEKIQTMVNERSIDGAKKRKWRKQKISIHLLLGETLTGRLVMSKKFLNAVQNKKLKENVCKQWQVDRDSCSSTWSSSALSELSPCGNQNNRRSPVFD